MNLPRYKFSKEAEPQLLQFLKIATEQKSHKNCNLESYEVWKKLLPLVSAVSYCANVVLNKSSLGSDVN